jgi:large subunit ribosomal protein L22
MEVKAIQRFVRMSAFKVRDVTREIQGRPVAVALDIVAFSPKKAAFLVQKTLKSAIANAENNHNLRADTLVVKEAVAGESTTIKRFTPKARGSAGPIRKRTSHIFITLTDEITVKQREKKTGKSGKKTAKPAKPASKKPAEQAAEKPAEKPAEQPAEPTAEQPAEKSNE